MTGPWARSVAIVVCVGVLAGCGGGGGGRTGGDGSAGATRPTAAITSTDPVAPPSSASASAAASPVDRLFGVGDAHQVIAVVADDYGQATGTLTAYDRGPDGWRRVFGPWPVFVGENGFAPPGEKREGDGRTPSGPFDLDFAFGVSPDPGTKLPFRRITSDAIVWDDDPASARYNLWTDITTEVAGDDPEPMYNRPAYDYGAVIAYNIDRTPGLGSAIFLHVSTDRATAGCVSLPEDRLLEILRWLDPARSPRIVMGTQAAVAP